MASISCCPRSFSTHAPVTSRRSFRYKCFMKNRLCTPPCPEKANVGPDPASRPHESAQIACSALRDESERGFRESRESTRLPARTRGRRSRCLRGTGYSERKALFGSRDSGRRESGAGASTLQAQGTAIRTLLRAAQTALLREAERATQAEEGSRHPPRTTAPAADRVPPLKNARADVQPEPRPRTGSCS